MSGNYINHQTQMNLQKAISSYAVWYAIWQSVTAEARVFYADSKQGDHCAHCLAKCDDVIRIALEAIREAKEFIDGTLIKPELHLK